MKWRRILVASAMVFTIFLPTSGSAASKFSDVGPRFEKQIDYLASRNIVKGYNDGTFGVNKPVTRGEAVVMLVREIPIKFEDIPDPGFTDIKKGDGFYTEVAAAVKEGFITGKIAKNGSRYFDPEGFLTRAEMALILTRAYDIPLDRYEFNFKDVSPQMAAKKAIDALANGGITHGFEDYTFKPYAPITRQEFAAFLARTVNVEFNRMRSQFVRIDPATGKRVKLEWLSEAEISKQEVEMADRLNALRINKGLPALKKNERLFEMARLKTRALARFPFEEYVFTEYENFYNSLYGETLGKKVRERFSGGSIDQALYFLGQDYINEPSLIDASIKDLGVGLAQNMDGTFSWGILYMYK